MAERIYDIVNRYTWLAATVCVLLLFITVNIAATPLLNSGDDAFLMYTLAGGFGESPTGLLHYNYGWHFFLSTLIKSAYSLSPSFNWYALFLTGIHIAGGATIFYVLLKRMQVYLAALLFLILFFFIEVRLLLSLSFTGTAMVAATAGVCMLFHQLQTGKIKSRSSCWGFLLLLVAGLLRMHAVWLAIALMVPLAITLLRRKQVIQWGLITLLSLLLLWVLNGLHQQYYRKHIPGWEAQEQYRQVLFYTYNHPHQLRPGINVFTDSTEMQLYYAGFFYDGSRFTKSRIDEIGKGIIKKRSFSDKEDRKGLYWFWIEMRIYIAVLVFFLVAAVFKGLKNAVYKWFLSLLAFLAAYIFLFLYMKVTTTMHLGMLFILWTSFTMQIRGEAGFVWRKKIIAYLYVFPLLLLFAWMGYRIGGEEKVNKNRHQRFLCAVESINQHRDKLFVATYDIFPLDYFYVWDVPGKFPVTNLLYKDRLLTHTYPATLKRMGIDDFTKALHTNKNIYLLGPPLPALLKKETGESFTDKLPGFGCLEVRQFLTAE